MNEIQTAFACGYVSRYLEDFSLQHGIPTSELTAGVATLLHASASRQVLGPSDRMPTLSHHSTKRGSTPRKMAVAGRARRKTQLRARAKSGWTAKRRREYSNRMRKLQPLLQAARHRAVRKVLRMAA